MNSGILIGLQAIRQAPHELEESDWRDGHYPHLKGKVLIVYDE